MIKFIKHTNGLRRDLILTIIFSTISYASFIGSFLIVLLHENIASPIMIGIIFSIQRIMKTIIGPVISVFIDMHGTKFLMIASAVITVICSMLCILQSYYISIVIVLLYGIALSIKIHAINTRIANILRKYDLTEQYYNRIMSVSFIASDCIMGVIGYIAASLYEKGGYIYIFIATTIWSGISIIIAIFLKNDKISDSILNKNIQSVVQNSYKVISNNITIVSLTILLAAYEFFGWRFGQIIKLLLLENGIGVGNVIRIYSITRLLMGTGSIIAFFISSRISVRISVIIWITHLIIMSSIAFISYKIDLFNTEWPIIIMSFLLYPLTYTTMQLPPMKAKIKLIPSAIRATIDSVGTIIILIINSAGNMIIATIASKYGYSIGIGTYCIITLISTIVCIIYINSQKVNTL